jgi:hypothetical protein
MSAATTQTQVRQLAKAVSAAFAAAMLPDDVMESPKIGTTNLSWQLPPLQTNLVLQGYDLEQLLTTQASTTAYALHRYWGSRMVTLKYSPHLAYHRSQTHLLANLLPKELGSTRNTLFANIDPADEYAGICLSLEVANLAAKNLPIKDMGSDDSNYWVKTMDGYVFGVQRGLPLVGANDWTTDATGLVQVFLETLRGKATTVCLFDTIALARSLLHEHKADFGKDFIAVDYALQALRSLTLGRTCPALMQSVHKVPLDKQLWTNKVVALTEAEAIMETSIADRDKLHTLESLLVPLWYSMTNFKRNIFSGKTYPYMLEPSKVLAIKDTLKHLWQLVPEQMK